MCQLFNIRCTSQGLYMKRRGMPDRGGLGGEGSLYFLQYNPVRRQPRNTIQFFFG